MKTKNISKKKLKYEMNYLNLIRTSKQRSFNKLTSDGDIFLIISFDKECSFLRNNKNKECNREIMKNMNCRNNFDKPFF